MVIDVSQGLKSITGQPMTEVIDGQPVAVTLKSILVNALLMAREDDTRLTGEEKVKRYRLANEIYAATGIMNISLEDGVLLKGLIAKTFSTWVTGQALELLEK